MLKSVLAVSLAALLAGLAGCQTKSLNACKQDVERIKDVSREAGFFLEALRPEMREAEIALDACDSRFSPCKSQVWLDRLTALRTQEAEIAASFHRAADVYDPEACTAYTQAYQLNPPNPAAYNGYYSNFEQAERRLDDLIERFRLYAF